MKTKNDLKNNPNCSFTRAEFHGDNEILIQNGKDIGLFEVDKSLHKNWSQLYVDHVIAEHGTNELRRHLIDMARNGAVLFKILLGKHEDLFLNTSEFIKRDVRFVRGLYCIQKMAKDLQEKYAKYTRTVQAVVQITITSIWIGNKEIYDEMNNVETLKRKLSEIVESLKNNPNPKNIGKFQDIRSKIEEGIIKIARTEEDLKNGKKGSKVSSMALVGYLTLSKNPNQPDFNKCSNLDSKQCVSFFHVEAKDD
uniref:DNA-directed RNA polymerase n=1 Tax=Meloidogyne hapla TaxID=6305 RepID=A0A1I8B1T3_MELHA